MRRIILFMAIIIFLFINSTLLAADNPDTCEIISLDNVKPYSRVEVPVRAFTDQDFLGLEFDLVFRSDSNSYLFCDSVQWTDWFWDNPGYIYYSGDGTLPYMKREKGDTLQVTVTALWMTGNLPSKDSILAVIHLSLGKIEVTKPDSEDVWDGASSEFIRWNSSSPWDTNDTIEVDTLRWFDTGDPQPDIRFVNLQSQDVAGEFKPGQIIRSAQISDSVKIEYSADAGRTWSTVVASTPNDGEYLWSPIPDTTSDSCLIRISSKVENPISVLSDSFFSIKAETTGVREEKKPENLPEKFVLYQNYPNPFNLSTKIEFSLSKRAQVMLEIYDITGRRVKKLVDETLSPGHWSIVWEGEDDKGAEVASGVYFYRLRASQYTQTRKMVIIK